MSLVDKILAGVEHYANAVFVRTYILREGCASFFL
jgi:hypothetical protein